MNESHAGQSRGPSHRGVEIGVATVSIVLALVTVVGSLISCRGGPPNGPFLTCVGWGLEGPRAGLFPFGVGILMLVAALANLGRALATRHHRLFAEWSQVRQVVAVGVPTGIYVVLISGIPAIAGIGFPEGFLLTERSMLVPGLGIYLASAILIGGFMKILGGYRWPMTLAVAIVLPVLTYVVFEKYFLVSLPKGPIEAFLEPRIAQLF